MKPLEGIRILSFCQYGAGPFATLHLADLGAEVIKIEDRKMGGDVSRSVIPYADNGDSLYFQSLNRNKKSITLDMKSQRGQQLFQELVKKSDAVFNNLRGDVPERLGLTYEQLKHIKPAIVTCSLSGFGTSGSMKAEPAYDYLLQAMVGHMSLTGSPDTPPEKYGISMIDFSTGIMAALGIMVGLFQAKIRGTGCDVDVSLFDTAASMLNYLAIWSLNRDYKPQKTSWSAHPSLVPSQMFPTKSAYVVVMCNKEKFFKLLCEGLEMPALANDERYQNFQARLQNRETLIETLITIFKTETSEHWIQKLGGKVPITRVNSIAEALAHPLMKERGMIVESGHPTYGNLKMMSCPVKVSNHDPEFIYGPRMGQHNAEVFQDLLGLSDEEIKHLAHEGIL